MLNIGFLLLTKFLLTLYLEFKDYEFVVTGNCLKKQLRYCGPIMLNY